MRLSFVGWALLVKRQLGGINPKQYSFMEKSVPNIRIDICHLHLQCSQDKCRIKAPSRHPRKLKRSLIPIESRSERPIAAVHDHLKMLRCGPSLRTFAATEKSNFKQTHSLRTKPTFNTRASVSGLGTVQKRSFLALSCTAQFIAY